MTSICHHEKTVPGIEALWFTSHCVSRFQSIHTLNHRQRSQRWIMSRISISTWIMSRIGITSLSQNCARCPELSFKNLRVVFIVLGLKGLQGTANTWRSCGKSGQCSWINLQLSPDQLQHLPLPLLRPFIGIPNLAFLQKGLVIIGQVRCRNWWWRFRLSILPKL